VPERRAQAADVPPPVGGASNAAAAGSLADGLTCELLVRGGEVPSGTSCQVLPRRAARRQVMEDSISDIPDGWETGKAQAFAGRCGQIQPLSG